jgi:DNA-directed RNA polymerase specialized sigma24 family protein
LDWKDFDTETTEDLVQYIKWKNQPEYTEAAESAFVAFSFRFRGDVIKKCEIICSRWNYDVDVAIELANRTFYRFWLNPNYDDSKRKNAKTFDDGVLFYLYGIANRELINFYRESKDPSPYKGDEDIVWDFPDSLEKFKPERRKELELRREVAEMALSRLSPKHKPIYLTYLFHGLKGKNLPTHLLKKLRDELGLGQATIRYYNNEAKTRVDDYLKLWEKAKK